MWLVLGISFVLVVFVSLSRGWTPFLYTLVVAGFGTLVSGLAMKLGRWFGRRAFFAAAIAGVYLPNADLPLSNGVAMVGGYLIPGYLLKKNT